MAPSRRTASPHTPLARIAVSPRAAHPKIQIELVVGSAALDLVRREADVAVRLFRDTAPSLIARKIGDIGWSVFASREYVDRTGIVPGPDVDLGGHAMVGFKGPVSRAPGACWLAQNTRPEKVVLSGDSVASVVNAVRAGLGVSTLPCFLAPENPTLVRLTPAVVAHGEAFVVIPPDHRDTARVRLVVDRIDASLVGRDYVCGSRYTLADAFVTAALARFRLHGFQHWWSDRDRTNVGAYYDRMRARPSWAAAGVLDEGDERAI